MKLSIVGLWILGCVLLASCSKAGRPSVLGHWQAERATFFSAHLPVGPDIVISQHAVSVPDTDASIPLNAITLKDNEAVLEMPYGVGVSFYFDGPNRMYLDLPVLGKIYYQRVIDSVSTVPPALATSPPVESTAKRAESLTTRQVPVPVPHVDLSVSSPSDFDLALHAAKQGDNELALDSLRRAFSLGFRGFGQLDSAPELAGLRADVRYQALVARYR